MNAFFFVDEDGTENVSNFKPHRHDTCGFWVCEVSSSSCKNYDAIVELPRGTIEALFKKSLAWEDEPIVIKF